MEILDIKDNEGIVLYWKEQLEEFKNKPVHEAAYRLVGVVSHPDFDRFFDYDTGDPDILEVFDLASNLEIPPEGPPKPWRADAWDKIQELMAILEQRYLN